MCRVLQVKPNRSVNAAARTPRRTSTVLNFDCDLVPDTPDQLRSSERRQLDSQPSQTRRSTKATSSRRSRQLADRTRVDQDAIALISSSPFAPVTNSPQLRCRSTQPSPSSSTTEATPAILAERPPRHRRLRFDDSDDDSAAAHSCAPLADDPSVVAQYCLRLHHLDRNRAVSPMRRRRSVPGLSINVEKVLNNLQMDLAMWHRTLRATTNHERLVRNPCTGVVTVGQFAAATAPRSGIHGRYGSGRT